MKNKPKPIKNPSSLSTESENYKNIRFPLSSLEKNIQRLQLRQPLAKRSSTRNSLFPEITNKTENKYIDAYYPNGSSSLFINRVSLPGDWDFCKKIYQDESRLYARAVSKKAENVHVTDMIEQETNTILKELLKNSKTRFCKMQWQQPSFTGPAPVNLEGATALNIKGSIYIYGGESNTEQTNLFVLNPRRYQWRMVSSSNTPSNRLGHSAISFDNKMLIFGGYDSSSTIQNQNECSNNILILDTTTMDWSIEEGLGEVPSSRRHHCGAAFGRSMVIFGGYSPSSSVLDDVAVYDIPSKEWTIPQCKFWKVPQGRAHATLTPVFRQDTLKSTNSDVFSSRYQRDFDGFYLFGGLSQDGEALNDLWVLKFSEDGYMWNHLAYSQAPLPRYKHTCVYLKSMLVVYGGRNDYLRIDSHSISDVGFFLFDRQKWGVFHIANEPPVARWDHFAAAVGNRIIIFGGQNYRQNLDSYLHVLEISK